VRRVNILFECMSGGIQRLKPFHTLMLGALVLLGNLVLFACSEILNERDRKFEKFDLETSQPTNRPEA
jgi:hypothetical protein